MRIFNALVICLFCLGFSISSTCAQGRAGLSIIRDYEIESTLKGWLTPLLEAAEMGPDSVRVIIVQSDQVNAFVAGGANIFVYTGLLQATKNPQEVIGVLAHELGHIEGGHLIAQRGALEKASYESILGTVLGIGAAILAGDGRAASALSLGGQNFARSNFLAHSRVKESSADQAALRLMGAAELPADGFLSFFETLAAQELLPASQQNEYARSHPLTQNRMNVIREAVAAQPRRELPGGWAEQHARMNAKLLGFIEPVRVAWRYAAQDQSFAARYARAIAAYRRSKVDPALQQVRDLIAEESENAALHELEGQILMEFGRVPQAVPSLRRAVALAPDSGLLRIMLAHALIESTQQNTEQLQIAIDHLKRARVSEPRNSRVQRLLATAYGRMGDEVRAHMALAEEAVLLGRRPQARDLLQRVLGAPDVPADVKRQAQDLKAYLDVKP